MATIDKPLPNTNISETVIEVPKQEEIIQATRRNYREKRINKVT